MSLVARERIEEEIGLTSGKVLSLMSHWWLGDWLDKVAGGVPIVRG